jgi:hypothetical protein
MNELVFIIREKWQIWRLHRRIVYHGKLLGENKFLKWHNSYLKYLKSGALTPEGLTAVISDAKYLFEEKQMSTEITLGSKVVIKECHSMPQLIGKTGVVKALLMVDATNPYPMYVWLDEPIQMSQALPIPGVSIQQEWRGPHLCRPDELALVGSEQTNIPDAFNKAFDEKPPEEKKDDGSSK